MLDTLKKWWNKPGDDVAAAMEDAFQTGRRVGIEESAQLCEKKAEEFVRRELETIEQDEWSSDHFYEENDESNPKVIAENGAKATGWMMLQCAADIRKMISNALAEPTERR